MEEWEETAPDGKVTIRETDRGDTVETAALYDENFGGFGDKGLDGPYTARFRTRRKGGPGIGHNCPPIRLLKCRHFIGGAGPTGWAGVQPSGPPPFVSQGIRQAEQSAPLCHSPERDRADELERLERRLRKLAEPTDWNAGPSASYARGVLREERFQFFAQHTERRIQALYCRRCRPSATLEAKRFPKLPLVATKLFPKETRKQPAAERRAVLEAVVADYLACGGAVTVCPPETITKRSATTKMGRPLIGKRPMTAAERKRRSRAKWKLPSAYRPPTVGVRPVPSAPPLTGVRRRRISIQGRRNHD